MDNPAFQNDKGVNVKPAKKHLTRTNSTLTPTSKSWYLTQMPQSKLCRCNSVLVPKHCCAEEMENNFDGSTSLEHPFFANKLPKKNIPNENPMWTKEFWSDSYNRLHDSSPPFQSFHTSKPGVVTIYDPHFLSSKFSYSGSHHTVSNKEKKMYWWLERNSSHRVAAILCALMLTLLASGNIIYILQTVGKPMESTSKNPWFDIVLVKGEFRITNEPYRLTLANRSSNDFHHLSNTISHQLDSLFSLSIVAENYHSTAVSELLPGSGLLVHCQVVLRPSPLLRASKVGIAFIGGLRNQHSHMWLGNFSVDIQSIGFQASEDAVSWTGWSEWGNCHQTQEFGYMQLRSRNCTLRSGQPLYNTLPCLLVPNSLGNVETAPCLESLTAAESSLNGVKVSRLDCNNNGTVQEILFTAPNSEQAIKNGSEPCACADGEVCLAVQDQVAPQCLPKLEPADPTGCGGHCKISIQLCQKIRDRVFRCVDDSKCLEDEWKCANQLCIPQNKRCDGHFNCYDHTDEHNCDCNLTTHFQCGNRMSCLLLTKRCDAVVDCWDATDELNCTIHCVGAEQFTCNDSQCIPNHRFCDGFPDCKDHSDEPFGCSGECKTHEWKCRNSRCVPQNSHCDGTDDCEDGSDEADCPTITPD